MLSSSGGSLLCACASIFRVTNDKIPNSVALAIVSHQVAFPGPSSWFSAAISPPAQSPSLPTNFISDTTHDNTTALSLQRPSSNARSSDDGFRSPDPCDFLSCSVDETAMATTSSPNERGHSVPRLMDPVCKEKASYAKKTSTGIVLYSELDFCNLKLHNGRGYRCPCCSKCLRDKFNFRDHYMSHTGEKPLGCSICSYTCLRKKELTGHMKSKHSLK